MSACLCGCGQAVPPHRDFVSGHDLRAVMAIVRQHYGDAAGFVRAHNGEA